MNRVVCLLSCFAALGSWLMAGVFFAFSTFVMKGLSHVQDIDGMRAMQSINVAATSTSFVLVFMATALVSLPLAASALSSASSTPARVTALVGSALYLFGVFGVTVARNVPMNDALARSPVETMEGVALWADYLIHWTRWNHVRTVASILAAIAFTLRAVAGLPASWLR